MTQPTPDPAFLAHQFAARLHAAAQPYTTLPANARRAQARGPVRRALLQVLDDVRTLPGSTPGEVLRELDRLLRFPPGFFPGVSRSIAATLGYEHDLDKLQRATPA